MQGIDSNDSLTLRGTVYRGRCNLSETPARLRGHSEVCKARADSAGQASAHQTTKALAPALQADRRRPEKRD